MIAMVQRLIDASEIVWWVGAATAVGGFVAAIVLPVRRLLRKYEKMLTDFQASETCQTKLTADVTAIKKATLAQIKVKINKLCDNALRRGYILPRELEEVELLFESYTPLGGNGVTASKVTAIRKLPIKGELPHDY